VAPFLEEIRETLVPPSGARHGPLPPLLVVLTVVTGLVDAFSYLVLGHVFVANMTGNVVFLGFALAGAPGFSIVASAVALASFFFGALVGGRIGAQLGEHRARQLSSAVSMQAVLVAVSVVLAALSPSPVPARYRYPLIVALGAAMGIQNATARRLAVPDLTTTVLTLTLTGAAADSGIAGGKGSKAGRRFVSVAAMFVGALAGAAFVLHAAIVLALVSALVALVVIAVIGRLAGRGDPAWVRP
jgi:uncharacterized membrane protein YoaK (UPF0700 family)